LIKSFPIPVGRLRESQKIDFRAEFFNVPNKPNFYNPDATVLDTTFGEVLSAADPRIIQFSLKYIF